MDNGTYQGIMNVEETETVQATLTITLSMNEETQTENNTATVGTQTTDCYGCITDHPSQTEHMGPGGCLELEDYEVIETSTQTDIPT